MQGWIKLHRKVQEHWIYQEDRKFSKYEAWLDLIMMANHKRTTVLLGNELVKTQRGQVITSELKLMKKWNWGKNRLRTFLGLLESDGMIVKKSDRKKTVITICKYSVYHENEEETEPQSNHSQTTSGPKTDTIKNVKNEKNEKKNKKEVVEANVPPSLYQEFKNCFNYEPTPVQMDLLGSYIDQDGMQEELVKWVLKETGKNGKEFAYAKAWLNNSVGKGILTLKDALKAKEEHERKKQHSQSTRRTTYGKQSAPSVNVPDWLKPDAPQININSQQEEENAKWLDSLLSKKGEENGD
jgi:DnaD/phage-associated family protein